MPETKEQKAAYMAQWYAKRQAERLAGPHIPCGCGCGELIPAVTSQGHPALFKNGHNAPERWFQRGHGLLKKNPIPRGPESPNWKGGRPKNGRDTRFQPGHGLLKKNPTPRGTESPNWKGGERRNRKGYVESLIAPEQAMLWPTGFRCKGSCYIMRSHKVWNEAHPDDLVQRGEVVHHANKVRDDDRPENLRKMSASEHNALHWRDRKRQV